MTDTKTNHKNVRLQYSPYPFVSSNTHVRNGSEICNVQTPLKIVSLTWKLVQKYRDRVDQVVDFGAGDGRFALNPNFRSYRGVEIKEVNPRRDLPTNTEIVHGCALDVGEEYDLSIGNPPYVQHHHINPEWKAKINSIIVEESGHRPNMLCNMFVYFLWLSLLRTKPNGLIALVTPYEWVSRPSSKQLRDYIQENQWDVDVYRFENSQALFPQVLTTAAITIIDKSRTNSRWSYFNIKEDLRIVERDGITDTPGGVLPYTRGGIIRARRGLSPGSQKVFTFTEQERLDAGIELSDVVPAVTSLRSLSKEVRVFDYATFREYYIDGDLKCWLLNTQHEISPNVMNYLASAPQEEINRWTCQNRKVWYRYSLPPLPEVLYSSGFVHRGPKVVVNKARAINVGSVHGIIGDNNNTRTEDIVDHLRAYDFESRIVPHAKTLKKVEVNQMNWVIQQFLSPNGSI